MEKNITLKGVEINPALRDKIEKKIDNLKKFFDHIVSIDLLLWKDSARYVVEIRSHLGHKMLTVKEESYRLTTAFDSAYKKMKREIGEYKRMLKEK